MPKKKKLNKKIFYTLIVIILIALGYWALKSNKSHIDQAHFEMGKVTKGNLAYEVTATGTINPINTVTVGTQVSGIVEKVLADYNDDVKEGQVLALLDSSTLKEQMEKSEANYELAKAKESKAKLNYERIKKLYQDKLTSSASLEDAEIEYKESSANVLSAKADYNISKKNFEYATITSPVSGTVITKEIEQGQTVAASFSTPTLFEVAEDLSKMQIEASVSEADIGYIKPDMPATFTVDAYPNDKFFGKIRQVRLSPTEESNVVMYTVIIEIDNSSRKLLPGMTASVNIIAEEAKDVLMVSAMALQYKPSAAVKALMDVKKIKDIAENQDVVYLFEKGKIVPRVITKGLSDMTNIEVKEGLSLDEEVIIEANEPRKR
ncbi:MAG: efflux RND transporter periplasmic adaptor subunit [Alphaproteobacteria bacterium]|nr:efflux RND transporter periplasmic adaptor subunit [Alphaproteobacteria bacterium]